MGASGTFVLEAGPKFKLLAHNTFAPDTSMSKSLPMSPCSTSLPMPPFRSSPPPCPFR